MRLAGTTLRTLPLLCLGLAGCSGLFQSKAKPEQTYYLRAPAARTAATSAPAIPASVRVIRPAASPGLDTSRIMLVEADHRMNFFSGSRWPATAPELIEALAVQTLRTSGAWVSVGSSGGPFPADYLLQIQLQRFEADYSEGTAGAPVVHVVLECVVGRREGREVLTTFTAAGSAAAAANRLGEVVMAFEQATGVALEALSRQTEQAVRADRPPREIAHDPTEPH